MNRVLWPFFLCCIASIVSAGGFQIPLEGQKQMGMGGAGTAVPQDASVMFYNPGGLSFTQYSQISISGILLLPKIQFAEKGTNNLSSNISKPIAPFSFYASFSHKPTDKWKIGLAVYTPYGAVIQWPSNWSGRYVLYKANLTTINVQPTFSYKIANKVGIGVSVVYSFGSVDFLRAVPLQDTLGNTGTAELTGQASGVGFNLGVYYEISKKISIGVSYKHKITYSPKHGSAVFTVPSALKDSFPNTSISTSVSTPYEIDLGISYKPTQKLTLAFDASYTGWSVFDNIHIHFAQTNTLITDMDLPRHFNNSFTFRLGGQYALSKVFLIRAGTFLDLTPVADGYVPPEVPDANRYGFAVGGSAILGHFEVDLTLGYLETLARTETNNYASLNGTYRASILAIGLGINYNFYKSKKEKKKDLDAGQ